MINQYIFIYSIVSDNYLNKMENNEKKAENKKIKRDINMHTTEQTHAEV